MTLDYFYGQAGKLFSFYRIPKALFQEQRFQNLSTDAKTLYGILLDRMSLSVKNEWFDKQGRVFIIFTIEDVKRALCCADNKATKLLRELENFGLIERKRRGLGKPSLVYVKNFSSNLSNERVQNRENHESGAFKKECQDPPKSRCYRRRAVVERGSRMVTKKAPLGLLQGALRKGAATYSPGLPVPSAWRGLTSLFGMGRGGTPAL